MMQNGSKQLQPWGWTEDLSIGIDEIDADHKMMFQLFDQVLLISQKKSTSTYLYYLIADLINFTELHFKREEAIVSVSNYPYCENYKAIHRALIKQIKQQFYKLEAGHQTSADFVVFLKSWFLNHIKGIDQRISHCILEHENNAKTTPKLKSFTPPKHNCHIYLVDDDLSYLELMQAMSEAANLHSTAFSSGTRFLLAPVTDNDLVVLDLNMPEKDGIEIMRELADKCLSPTFILISGFDERVLHSAKQLAESKQLRVAKILSKPVDTEVFIDVLTKVYQQCELSPVLVPKPKVKTTPKADIRVEELKQALEKQELLVYLQPQIRFEDNKLEGAEVLVRWHHPIQGLVFPDQFIPLAEQHNMMEELTETVILESIKVCQQFRSADIQINLSINLSAQNICNLELPEKLDNLLRHHHIDPETFTLELTESEMLTDTSSALDIFNRLRMKGFSLSIDDFGTGDSSLKKLYQTPFSELKIDQHFVRRMAKDQEAVSIARICILLAKEFRMHTVAEGVETQAIWDKLKDLGCDMAQGYLIAKPMPVKAFIKFYHDNQTSS